MSDALNLQGIASQAVAWLLTYALHSTLFLGLAWLVARRLAQRMPAVEEAVWRFALVAGLVTASLQTGIGREPLTGSWRLTAARPAVAAPAAVTALPLSAAPGTSEATPAVRRSVSPPSPSFSVTLPLAVTGLWLAGSLLFAATWLAACLRLRRRLRPRPQILEAQLVSLLQELCERAGLRRPVRLTCSSRLPVPIALGVLRAEICVPPRALAGLAPEQQEGMLAHELAHLVRQDPFWLTFGRLLSGVFFFQPLNWIAVRRLRELSELLCDEWAVGRTGRPVSLARCLAEVAGWSFQPLGSLPAPGMADRPSSLARRIRRLLEEARSPQRRVHPLALATGMLILVVVVAAAAPGVQAAVARRVSGQPASAPVLAAAAAPRDQPAPRQITAGEEAEEDVEAPEPDAALAPLDAMMEAGMAQSLSNLDAELAGLDDLLKEALSGRLEGEGFSEEEARALEERVDAITRSFEQRMETDFAPRMEALGERLAANLESSALQDIQRRAQEIAKSSRISEEDMEKLQADFERLRTLGTLTEEDNEKLRVEIIRMTDANRLSDQEKAEIDLLRKQARELAERTMREHKGEIEQMRKEIEEETRALREELRRQLENEPRIRALRERRERRPALAPVAPPSPRPRSGAAPVAAPAPGPAAPALAPVAAPAPDPSAPAAEAPAPPVR